MARRPCKYGKLKNPVGRRRCKKRPARGGRSASSFAPPRKFSFTSYARRRSIDKGDTSEYVRQPGTGPTGQRGSFKYDSSGRLSGPGRRRRRRRR